jgi:hypothetical protein
LLRQLTNNGFECARAAQHLAKFHPEVIAEEYLALFRAKLS